jgi:hypothetical protein
MGITSFIPYRINDFPFPMWERKYTNSIFACQGRFEGCFSSVIVKNLELIGVIFYSSTAQSSSAASRSRPTVITRSPVPEG